MKSKKNITINNNNVFQKKLSIIKLSSLCTPLIFSSIATLAHAQSESYQVEEVIVTAQKRAENIQDIPVSVYNYSDDELKKTGAKDFTDVAASTPGLTMAKSGVGGARYFIRGVGQVTVNQAPTTGVYLDETPLQVRTSFGVAQVDPQLIDVESVEVLRGPQGSLFGSSSTGGAVRILTRQPDLNDTELTTNITYSSTKHGGDNTTLSGVVNVPFANNKAALRIAASFDDQSGFIDDLRPTTNDIYGNAENRVNDINDLRSDMIRASLKFQATDSLTLTPSIFYQDQNAGQQRQEADLTFSEEAKVPLVARYMDTYTNDETLIGSFKAEWESDAWGGIEVVSATSYMDREVDSVFDLSPFSNGGIERLFPKPAPYEDRRFVVGLFNDDKTEQFSQEVRLTSTSNSPLQYIAGFFYKDVESTSRKDRNVLTTFNTAVDPIIRESTNIFEEEETALFGELSYLLENGLKATIGGRYFHIDQKETRQQYGIGGAARGSEDFGFTDTSHETGFSPKAVLSYAINDNANVYVNYSEGFRSGGINAPIVDDVCSPTARAQLGIPGTPDPYESDKTKSTEIGLKTQFFDNRLTINASGYTTDWEDFQLSVQQDCGGDGSVARFTANAGDVSIDGFELEMTAYLMEQLRVSGGYGYTDAVFNGSTDSALQARGISAGSDLFDVPEHTWNLQVEYSTSINDQMDGYLYTSAHHVDDSLTGFGEGEAPARPAYTVVNLRTGVETEHWDLALFANNLTNETVIHGLQFASNPVATNATSWFAAFVGQPRTVGLDLKIKF